MNSMNKQHPMGWFNFDFSQSVMDAVQDLRSPANRIGFPPTRGCRTTPASCPQNLRSGSSRKTGSRQIGNSLTSSAQNEIPYGGIGTYVRLGPRPASIGPNRIPPRQPPPPTAALFLASIADNAQRVYRGALQRLDAWGCMAAR